MYSCYSVIDRRALATITSNVRTHADDAKAHLNIIRKKVNKNSNDRSLTLVPQYISDRYKPQTKRYTAKYSNSNNPDIFTQLTRYLFQA